MTEPFTVLGATGTIGGHLVRHLRDLGVPVQTPGRDDPLTGPLGHVVYAIGLTADFRQRPLDAVEAHVGKLADVLRGGNFTSFLYLSSTRVYQRLGPDAVAEEGAVLPVDVNDPEDLYNITKLAGEAACLSLPDPAVRVVRISNVYGGDVTSDNFLTAILREARETGAVCLRSGLGSAKDYISIADVVSGLRQIAGGGRARLYNLAAGRNVSHGEIMEWLRARWGITVMVEDGAPSSRFPRISTDRLQRDFGIRPAPLGDHFATLLEQFRQWPQRA